MTPKFLTVKPSLIPPSLLRTALLGAHHWQLIFCPNFASGLPLGWATFVNHDVVYIEKNVPHNTRTGINTKNARRSSTGKVNGKM